MPHTARMHHAPTARRLRALSTAVVIVIATFIATPIATQAQADDRDLRRPVADATCLTGRACRLALVNPGRDRSGPGRDPVLMRGTGAQEYVLGPAWDRITFAVGTDPTAHALARDALAYKARAGRRFAIAIAGALAATATVATVAIRGAEDRAVAGLIIIPVVALPAGAVTAFILGRWADAAQRDADMTLEDAVHAWNRRVDPRVP